MSDYSSGHFLETFPSGSTNNATQCVGIFIVDDNALEGDQIFTLSLTTSDPSLILGTNLTTITITHNDSKYFLICYSVS